MRLIGALATHYHPDHVGGSLVGPRRSQGIARAARPRPRCRSTCRPTRPSGCSKATGVGADAPGHPRQRRHGDGGRDPDHADPHAGPHPGQPVLPRRRQARRRRHPLPRRLRPHRPARRRPRADVPEPHPAAGPGARRRRALPRATSTRRSRRRRWPRPAAATWCSARSHAGPVADDVRAADDERTRPVTDAGHRRRRRLRPPRVAAAAGQRAGRAAAPGDLRRRRLHQGGGRPPGPRGLRRRPRPTSSGASARAGRPTTTRPAWPRPFEMVGKFDVRAGRRRLRSPRSTRLQGLDEVRGGTGVLGFCLGGTIAHLVAAEGDPDAAVSYYGSGVADAIDRLADITCPVLLPLRRERRLHPDRAGRRRSSTPSRPADVTTCGCEVHAEAGHAFDNHEAPMFHDVNAAAAAWADHRRPSSPRTVLDRDLLR